MGGVEGGAVGGLGKGSGAQRRSWRQLNPPNELERLHSKSGPPGGCGNDASISRLFYVPGRNSTVQRDFDPKVPPMKQSNETPNDKICGDHCEGGVDIVPAESEHGHPVSTPRASIRTPRCDHGRAISERGRDTGKGWADVSGFDRKVEDGQGGPPSHTRVRSSGGASRGEDGHGTGSVPPSTTRPSGATLQHAGRGVTC